jgi:hypothetical protein
LLAIEGAMHQLDELGQPGGQKGRGIGLRVGFIFI